MLEVGDGKRVYWEVCGNPTASHSPTPSCAGISPPRCGGPTAVPALGRLRVSDLEVDPPSRDVRLRGARVELSQKEFALLRTLAAEPPRVFTKEELLRSIWAFAAWARPGRLTRMLLGHPQVESKTLLIGENDVAPPPGSPRRR